MSQYQQPAHHGTVGVGQQGGTAESRRRFPTASYLSPDVRESMIQQLTRTLADLTVLQKQAKFAHWNVKGMAFYGLHELFDDLAEALESHVDLVAERITALGGQAMGTAGQAVASCRLPAMPTDAVTGADYVDVMTERLAIADANLYGDIQAATEAEDVDTADLLNEVSRDVSTYLWFVEAHRQTQPVGTTAQGPAESATAQQAGYGQQLQSQSVQSPHVQSQPQQTQPRGQGFEPQTQPAGPGSQATGTGGRPRTAGTTGQGASEQTGSDRMDQLVAAEMQ